MKTLSTKLFALVFVIAMATGCASVTDAGMAEQADQPNLEQTIPAPTPVPTDGGSDYRIIVDKPGM